MREEDKKNEEIVRIYAHSGTFEYIPRETPQDQNVTAKPVAFPKCTICGKMEPEPFECEHCGQYYCDEHLAPEKHECTHTKDKEEEQKQEELALKMEMMARLEGISENRPDIYMLIDQASIQDLKEMLGHIDALENILANLSNSNTTD
jgi:hypothetical protein